MSYHSNNDFWILMRCAEMSSNGNQCLLHSILPHQWKNVYARPRECAQIYSVYVLFFQIHVHGKVYTSSPWRSGWFKMLRTGSVVCSTHKWLCFWWLIVVIIKYKPQFMILKNNLIIIKRFSFRDRLDRHSVHWLT